MGLFQERRNVKVVRSLNIKQIKSMGNISRSTLNYLDKIEKPAKEFVKVVYTKGGGEAEVEIALREGDNVEKRIASVIGVGVEYKIIEEDEVVEHVEQDENSQSARNEELMIPKVEEELEIDEEEGKEKVVKTTVKKRRKRTPKK